jgi:hypothetical protein
MSGVEKCPGLFVILGWDLKLHASEGVRVPRFGGKMDILYDLPGNLMGHQQAQGKFCWMGFAISLHRDQIRILPNGFQGK